MHTWKYKQIQMTKSAGACQQGRSSRLVSQAERRRTYPQNKGRRRQTKQNNSQAPPGTHRAHSRHAGQEGGGAGPSHTRRRQTQKGGGGSGRQKKSRWATEGLMAGPLLAMPSPTDARAAHGRPSMSARSAKPWLPGTETSFGPPCMCDGPHVLPVQGADH